MVVHKQDSSRVISRELVIGHLDHTNLEENQQVWSSCPTNMSHSENDMENTMELHVTKSKHLRPESHNSSTHFFHG